jgi:hypothetical protein
MKGRQQGPQVLLVKHHILASSCILSTTCWGSLKMYSTIYWFSRSLYACQHVISGDVWLTNFSQRHKVNILLREHCSAVQYFLVTTRSEISQDRTKLWWKLSLNQMDPYRQLEESKLNMLNKVPTGRFFLCYTNSIWWPWIFLNRLMYVVLVVDVIFMYFVTDWNIVV